jgi:hypothetical protein
VLLSLFPLTRVNILVGVSHDTLSFAEAMSPVTVIYTNAGIDHFSDTMLLIVFPSTNVFIVGGNTLLVWLCEILVCTFFSFANLLSKLAVSFAYTVDEVALVNITIGICGNTLACIAIGFGDSFTTEIYYLLIFQIELTLIR